MPAFLSSIPSFSAQSYLLSFYIPNIVKVLLFFSWKPYSFCFLLTTMGMLYPLLPIYPSSKSRCKSYDVQEDFSLSSSLLPLEYLLATHNQPLLLEQGAFCSSSGPSCALPAVHCSVSFSCSWGRDFAIWFCSWLWPCCLWSIGHVVRLPAYFLGKQIGHW